MLTIGSPTCELSSKERLFSPELLLTAHFFSLNTDAASLLA
jgi:hypothetical protein